MNGTVHLLICKWFHSFWFSRSDFAGPKKENPRDSSLRCCLSGWCCWTMPVSYLTGITGLRPGEHSLDPVVSALVTEGGDADGVVEVEPTHEVHDDSLAQAVLVTRVRQAL